MQSARAVGFLLFIDTSK